MGVFQRPLTPILLRKYRDTNGSCIPINIEGVYIYIYTLLSAKAILLQKYRDRNGRCIAILFKSIGVRGRFDSPEFVKGRFDSPEFKSACNLLAPCGNVLEGRGIKGCRQTPMGKLHNGISWPYAADVRDGHLADHLSTPLLSGPMRDTPPYRAIPFRDSIAEGGIACVFLIFIGYRASIAEIPLLCGGVSHLHFACSPIGKGSEKGEGVSHPIGHVETPKPRSAQ